MPQIILLGYDSADDVVALSTGAAALSEALYKKNFSIGLERLPFALDVDEQIISLEERMNQVINFAQEAFQLSSVQLLQVESFPARTASIKAAKPLIKRAKFLHFQQTILTAFQQYSAAPLFGLDESLTVSQIIEYLSNSGIKRAAIFHEKQSFFEMKKSLNALKVPLGTFFIHSSSYQFRKEMEENLRDAHIVSVNINQFYLSSSMNSFIQKASESLDEHARLLTSLKALESGHVSGVSLQPKLSSVERHSSSLLEEKMKNTLKEFRKVFNNDTGGVSNTTILGQERFDGEEDEEEDD